MNRRDDFPLQLRISVASAAWATLWLAGCGEPSIPTYHVTGGVKFETGEAVPHGVVEFRPVARGPMARGKLDQFGRFTLSTFASDDGAIAGSHQIVVVQHLPPPASMAKAPPGHAKHQTMFIAPEYSAYDSSGLSTEINADGPNEVNLIVRPLRSRH